MKLRDILIAVSLILVALFFVIQKSAQSDDSVGAGGGNGSKSSGGGQSFSGSDVDSEVEEKVVKSKRVLHDRKRSDVVTTESGLQYETLVEGEGDFPGPKSTVTVHYVGTLEDGTVFDSSRKRGRAASFPLNAVIPGWTEGLQLMKEGGITRFTIPPDLAYGERGAAGSIPANATLTFEVELLSFEDPDSTK